jgi:hypothetical protein
MTNLNLNPISDATRSAPAPAGTDGRMEIDATRGRQTQPPATPFRSVLAGGVSLLMTGAEVATHVVGGPVLAAAVHDARVGATGALAGAPPAGAGGFGAPPGSAIAAAAAGSAMGADPGIASVEALMQQGQASNLQLLALQQQVQQENQQFTTVSNVMRAKHDTAKAAVSNIRA